MQSLRIRLLAMLHVGFVWFGVALIYSALSQGLWLASGQPVLGLGADSQRTIDLSTTRDRHLIRLQNTHQAG